MFKNTQSLSYSRKSAGVLLLVGVIAGVTVGGGVGVSFHAHGADSALGILFSRAAARVACGHIDDRSLHGLSDFRVVPIPNICRRLIKPCNRQ